MDISILAVEHGLEFPKKVLFLNNSVTEFLLNQKLNGPVLFMTDVASSILDHIH